MLKAIIFDFDDTLVMTRIIVTQALIQTAKTYYNLIITKTEIDSLWNIPFTEFMRQLFQNCDDIESIIANYKTIRKLFSNKVYPDTISTLDTLRKGYKLGILSATTKELVLNDINTCGIGVDKFDFIQTEDDTSVHKPDPKVFEPTLSYFSKYNIQCNDMLYVGDAYIDYLAANGSGLNFVGIPRVESEKNQMIKKGVLIIQNLVQLLQELKNYA